MTPNISKFSFDTELHKHTSYFYVLYSFSNFFFISPVSHVKNTYSQVYLPAHKDLRKFFSLSAEKNWFPLCHGFY